MLAVGLVVTLVGLVSTAPPTSPAWSATVPTAGSPMAGSPTAGSPPVPGPPAVPPPGSAYLGAFVDPSGQGLSAGAPLGGAAGVAAELAALPTVEQSLARPLSIVEVSQGWRTPVDTGQLRQVVATGAVPMITWDCGDTDAAVAAGADDGTIDAFARQLVALRAPVLVRWFPDPTSPTTATAACLGTGGSSGYVAAFRHVRQVLQGAGATDAATVWSVATAQGSPPVWSAYYPGADATDWIAADGYGPSAGPVGPSGVPSTFASWYSTFAASGRPLLVSNTGAAPGSQRQFLTRIGVDLPTRYPLVKGLVYVDAPHEATQTQSALDADGLAVFTALSAAPYFQPARSPSATAVTADVSHPTPGQPVSLAGTVSAPDGGGALTYLADGAVIAGCSDLPVTGPTAASSRRCPSAPIRWSPPTAGTPRSRPRCRPPPRWWWGRRRSPAP